jgi:VIT1/CCC1 family predicted Fe2+/Mn2+ transporter
MRNDARAEHEARDDPGRLQATRRDRLTALKGVGFTLAIVIAPFLALLFGLTVALVVLAAGLAVTGWLAWSAARHVGAAQASRLRAAAALNLVLVVVTLAIVALRVTD